MVGGGCGMAVWRTPALARLRGSAFENQHDQYNTVSHFLGMVHTDVYKLAERQYGQTQVRLELEKAFDVLEPTGIKVSKAPEPVVTEGPRVKFYSLTLNY
jgi:hypothetical protein